MARAAPGTLRRADGETIAYLQRDGKQPSVVWLGGFKSDMRGNKADAIDAWAEARSRSFLRFDYYGHGESSGDFRNGTIGRWRDDALAVIDEVTDGPLVLAASSMGAWIALLAGRARPDRIRAMLLLAPAADFTEALMWARMTPDIRRQILKEGEWLRPSAYDDGPYPITRELIEDGRAHLVLHAPIALACPVHIVHGMKDPDVPWEHALTLMDRLSGDPRLTLVKNGDHRLSKPGDLRLICDTLETLVA